MAPETRGSHELANQALAIGLEIIAALFSVLKVSQVHEVSNEAVAAAIKRLATLLGGMAESAGSAQLVFLEEDVYLNSIRIRVSRPDLPRYVALIRQLKQLGVARIEATPAVSEGDVRSMLEIIKQAPQSAQAQTSGGITVDFAKSGASRLPEYLIDRRQYALRVYAKAVLFLREFAEKLQEQRVPPIRKAYRLVQDLVDIARADVLPLLGLSAIRDHGDLIFHHSVNAAVLSIAMGQRLKMPKQMLAELGMAGLLHDLGKLAVPLSLLRKEGPLTDADRQALARIPSETVRILAQHEALSRGHPVQLVLAYEHQVIRSLQDYVRLYGQQALYYQTQILTIANTYDALTTARAHRGPYLPDQALQLIMEQAGTKLDPVLVRVFANLLGRIPIGSLAILDDGSMGVVVHTAPESPQHPMLKIVLDARGAKIEGPYLDLALPGQDRKIVGSANPYEYGINVLKYLMA